MPKNIGQYQGHKGEEVELCFEHLFLSFFYVKSIGKYYMNVNDLVGCKVYNIFFYDNLWSVIGQNHFPYFFKRILNLNAK